MDKRKLQRLSQPVVDVYLGIEEQILINIAKRLARHDTLLEEDIQSWQSQLLDEIESLLNENLEFIAEQSGKTVQAVRKALQDAGYGLLMENRSEEHTSELQSRPHLVCRLLLEKKKKKK